MSKKTHRTCRPCSDGKMCTLRAAHAYCSLSLRLPIFPTFIDDYVRRSVIVATQRHYNCLPKVTFSSKRVCFPLCDSDLTRKSSCFLNFFSHKSLIPHRHTVLSLSVSELKKNRHLMLTRGVHQLFGSSSSNCKSHRGVPVKFGTHLTFGKETASRY